MLLGLFQLSCLKNESVWKMKKQILLITMVCLLITFNAVANPTPSYITNGNMDWSRGVSGSTSQEWDFLTSSNPAAPESSYNLYGNPMVVLYQVPVANPVTPFAWRSSYLGRSGVWAGDAVYADIIVPNTPETEGYKVVWMEVGFAAATIDQMPIIQPYIAGGQTGSFQWDQLSLTINRVGITDWYVMNISWLIVPNPQSEVITVGFAGTGGYIDYITVDTLCVIPVPGAVILGGIGVGLVGWMRRRKSIV